MKRFLKIVGGVILIVIIFSVMAGNQAKNVSQQSSTSSRAIVAATVPGTSRPTHGAGPTDTPSPTPTIVPTPTIEPGTAAENPAPFDQAVETDEVRVRVSNGRFESKVGFSKPKGGYKYLVFDARIEGMSTDETSYGQMSFSGQDADTGAGYDSEFIFTDNALGSDKLSKGEYVTGEVALEVQETAKRVIVKYDPNQFTPGDLYWMFE
jgi:hypothetical protein